MYPHKFYIAGFTAGGKTSSLRFIPKEEQQDWIYINTEGGKLPTFANNFKQIRLTSPERIEIFMKGIIKNPTKFKGIIIDSITMLISSYEVEFINKGQDPRKDWAKYAEFWKKFFNYLVANCPIPLIMTGHLSMVDLGNNVFVPRMLINGAIKNFGIESFFTTGVVVQSVSILELEEQENPYLHITDDDKKRGYKYVYQIQPKGQDSLGIARTLVDYFPVDMFYIDADAYQYMTLLEKIYTEKGSLTGDITYV